MTVSQINPTAAARAVNAYLVERGVKLSHSIALEIVARAYGQRNYQTFKAGLDGAAVGHKPDKPQVEQNVIEKLADIIRDIDRAFCDKQDFMSNVRDYRYVPSPHDDAFSWRARYLLAEALGAPEEWRKAILEQFKAAISGSSNRFLMQAGEAYLTKHMSREEGAGIAALLPEMSSSLQDTLSASHRNISEVAVALTLKDVLQGNQSLVAALNELAKNLDVKAEDHKDLILNSQN